MLTSILTTDHGTHSPETWAVATADMIFPYDPATIGHHRIAAQKLQTQIAEALMPHHEAIQATEKEHLAGDAEARYDAPHDVDNTADEAVAVVVAAAQNTPWAEHFSKPEVQAAVRDVVGSHFATAQHIERQHHAIHNPSDAAAVFRSRVAGVPL